MGCQWAVMTGGGDDRSALRLRQVRSLVLTGLDMSAAVLFTLPQARPPSCALPMSRAVSWLCHGHILWLYKRTIVVVIVQVSATIYSTTNHTHRSPCPRGTHHERMACCLDYMPSRCLRFVRLKSRGGRSGAARRRAAQLIRPTHGARCPSASGAGRGRLVPARHL